LQSALTTLGSLLCTAALTLTGAPAVAAGPAAVAADPVTGSRVTGSPVTGSPVTGSPGNAARAGHAAHASARGAARPGAAGTTVVAHRGASGYAPENTLAAVDAAAGLGVRWVEVDVQRTKDGELVLVHDTTLNRTTDAAEVFPDRAPWALADFTAAEVARLDAGSWFDESFAGEPVPSFGALLERLARHNQALLLEIKAPERYPGIEAEVLRELAEHGWLTPRRGHDRLIVQSFSADSVRTVHELDPRVRTGFLGTPPVAELPRYARFADQINPRHTTVTAEYLAAVHALRGPRGRRLEVFVWTVDDGPTAAALARLGVDGVITNLPDVIRAALKKS
jgi:glycerophosphoryl diester phosphodiesterase